MSYKLKERDLEIIEPIAERVTRLLPGQSLLVKDDPQSLDRLRYVVYSWLHTINQKAKFKCIKRTPDQLEIFRRPELSPVFVVQDKIQEFVRDHLIELETEDEVARRIREAILSNDLNIEEGTRALGEWQRVQGIPSKSNALARTLENRGGDST